MDENIQIIKLDNDHYLIKGKFKMETNIVRELANKDMSVEMLLNRIKVLLAVINQNNKLE